MDQKIREMQERIDKVGTARLFVPAKVFVDYSEMGARLPKKPKYEYGAYGHPDPWRALPEAKTIPTAEKLTEHSEPIRTSIHTESFSPPSEALNSPKTLPQSKGRSSWILWVWMALVVAFAIAQLIWVMS